MNATAPRKSWLFNCSSGTNTAVARATSRLFSAWAATNLRKKPALISCRTKAWVTRMPLTDSASVDESRLQVSCNLRKRPLKRLR